jgi:hypothetical protein
VDQLHRADDRHDIETARLDAHSSPDRRPTIGPVTVSNSVECAGLSVRLPHKVMIKRGYFRNDTLRFIVVRVLKQVSIYKYDRVCKNVILV